MSLSHPKVFITKKVPAVCEKAGNLELKLQDTNLVNIYLAIKRIGFFFIFILILFIEYGW